MDRPEIVCLCGSSRFVAHMAILAWELEKEGRIILSLHLLPDWYEPTGGGDLPADHIAEHEGVADQMDELHLRKIDLADRVLVCDFEVDGVPYIGESTRKEIAYARSTGVGVHFISEGPLVIVNSPFQGGT